MFGIGNALPAFKMEEPPPDAAKPPPAAPSTRCGNCFKEGVKLQCTRCLKVVYCNAACQKNDWQHHKRICEPPKAKPAPPAHPPRPSGEGEGGGGGGGGGGAPAAAAAGAAPSAAPAAAAAGAAPSAAPAAPRPARAVQADEVELDEEDLAALAAVKKTGYRVHWRKAEEEASIRAAIGSIAPQRVEEGSGGGGGEAPAPAAAAPAPAPASATSASSAWNAAGTFEQRHMGDWLRDKVSALLATAALHPAHGGVAVAGAGQLSLGAAVERWGESTADVLMARGRTKHVYDLSFAVPLPLTAEAGAKDGARALLVFSDVSNETAGAPREVKLELPEGLGDAARAALRDALRVDGEGAAGELVKAARGAVEQAVAQFIAL